MRMLIETFSSPEHKYTVEFVSRTRVETVGGHSFLEALDEEDDLLFSVAVHNINTVTYDYD